MTKGTKWTENENRSYYLYKKGTLPRKNSEKKIRLPILISATLKINVKFQILEKVV